MLMVNMLTLARNPPIVKVNMFTLARTPPPLPEWMGRYGSRQHKAEPPRRTISSVRLWWKLEERLFFIDNLLFRIHYIIVMIKWTGLAPWEFELPLPGSLTSTFLEPAGPEGRGGRRTVWEIPFRVLSERARERESVRVRESECERVRERERERVCERERDRERRCVCVSERESACEREKRRCGHTSSRPLPSPRRLRQAQRDSRAGRGDPSVEGLGFRVEG